MTDVVRNMVYIVQATLMSIGDSRLRGNDLFFYRNGFLTTSVLEAGLFFDTPLQ
jgi:hypothetical protein